MPVLPPETLNAIIEYYRKDPKTLFPCSLVSRQWLQTTRYHLFGDLTLHLGGAHEAAFLALLAHPLCSFSTSVRKLWLLPMQSAPLHKDADTRLAQLARLTAVRTLRIHYQKQIPHPTLQVLAHAFKDITTLLLMLRFPSFGDAVRFVSLFTRLEELEFLPIRTPPGDFPPAELRMPRQLRGLQIASLRGHERWFADNRVESLSTLSLSDIRPAEDIPLLDQMLHTFGPSIRHLTLAFSGQKGSPALGVNLQPNTQLRTLHVDLSKLTRPHLLPVVSALASPRLEQLVWRSRRAFDLAPEPWAGLDALLADRTRFPALDKFLIMAPGQLNPRVLMPRCAALGILVGEEDLVGDGV
ncbi:hypothetical protein C8J57DRAFT_1555067 [Mycena rebaudengoi]|nr:hypothetical protein C8J57DRAFT_1555067 [Mycena rebaudengoi]